ncbi:hypothetical protein ACFQZJ_02140 [Maribacter chungangensis]|uniref:Magnesium citrate secondary transporter n=1 Tax=Maribacter chungangensis TaxID=1069117 RepID=A0ABW3AZD2_9FLAO
MLITNIRRWYFLVFACIAIVVYGAQQLSFPLYHPINNYLNDLLCMPIVLKLCQYAVRSIKRDEHLNIPVKLSVTVTILYAIYFEVLLPKFNDRYTADFIDVILYFIGLVFFIWMENITQPQHKNEPDKNSTSP